ncbi:hypothetical protein, partial [Nocardia sp. NPDC020380]|uniref:hypothetical protein n=1 Tax=Nocardia sp. NPDC020380 TaxID=3364309 RepID=UPI0037B9ADD6
MTNNGHPAPGQRVTLPSGAKWESDGTGGSSTITLPGDGPIEITDEELRSPNSLVRESGPFGALMRAFGEVLGHLPNLFTDHVAQQAAELLRGGASDDDGSTRTRVARITSQTTLLNPAKAGGRSDGSESAGGGTVDNRSTSMIDEPIHRRWGGPIRGRGGPTDDANLAWVSNGEFVVNAAATSNALPWLEAINAGWVPSAQFLAVACQGDGTTVLPRAWDRVASGRGAVSIVTDD